MRARAFLDQRLSEVDQYLLFLKKTDRTSSALVTTRGRSGAPYIIDADMRRILKANFFVIYYNTVEAAISEGMNYIYDSIENRPSIYLEMNRNLRKLFVKDTLRQTLGSSLDRGRIYDESMHCIDRVVSGKPVSYNRSDKRAAGNLNADRIRDICDLFGVSKATPRNSKGGVDLGIVLKNRNSLAHGDATFTEVGRDYSVSDLRDIRRRSASFVRSIVRNMEHFADHEKYLA